MIVIATLLVSCALMWVIILCLAEAERRRHPYVWELREFHDEHYWFGRCQFCRFSTDAPESANVELVLHQHFRENHLDRAS